MGAAVNRTSDLKPSSTLCTRLVQNVSFRCQTELYEFTLFQLIIVRSGAKEDPEQGMKPFVAEAGKRTMQRVVFDRCEVRSCRVANTLYALFRERGVLWTADYRPPHGHCHSFALSRPRFLSQKWARIENIATGIVAREGRLVSA